MISELFIEKYKNIKEVHIKEIKPINLIIGKNNVGKTNFLEAIDIFLSENKLDVIIKHFSKKYEITEEEAENYLIFLFEDYDNISIKNENDFLSVNFSIDKTDNRFIEIQNKEKNIVYTSDVIREQLNKYKTNSYEINEFDKNYILDILKTNFEDVDFSDVLEEKIVEVNYIIMNLINNKNGYVLLDEIENGLHYTVQEKLWKIIFLLSKEFNIQVFATTHSWDTLKAFEEAIQIYEDKSFANVIKLNKIRNSIKPYIFNSEEMKIVIESNIEIR